MFDINVCSFFPTTCRNIKARCSAGSPTRLSLTLTVGTLPSSSSYTSSRDASAMLTFIISCLFFSVVRALPTLLSRDVFDPPITSPSASTIWQVGQTVTVIWYVQICSLYPYYVIHFNLCIHRDITNLPPASQLTDPNGTVVLGYMASSTDSEHLMIGTSDVCDPICHH